MECVVPGIDAFRYVLRNSFFVRDGLKDVDPLGTYFLIKVAQHRQLTVRGVVDQHVVGFALPKMQTKRFILLDLFVYTSFRREELLVICEGDAIERVHVHNLDLLIIFQYQLSGKQAAMLVPVHVAPFRTKGSITLVPFVDESVVFTTQDDRVAISKIILGTNHEVVVQ